MSTLSDAVAALRNVVLMQERLDVIRGELRDLSLTVEKVQAYAVSLDKRIVRIETLIEVSGGRSAPRRIEEQE